MSFCLPHFETEKFIEALKTGKINPVKLSEMTSKERHNFISDIVGKDNAKEVNALFESKLLLKNQQQGMINWAKKTAGLKPEVRRDLISRIEKLDKVLDPKDQDLFLEDLASVKLGTNVTFEEAKHIADLSRKITELKTGEDRMQYGRAKVELGNYISDLKNQNAPSFMQKPLGEKLTEIAGTSKGLKASLDNSAIFRQGWKTLFTNPTVWLKNAKQSFKDLVDQFGGKEVMNEVQADIQSRPTYDLMKKAKLDIGTTEEQFPSHLAEKVPLLGHLYKSSEAAYTGFVYRTRADVFDKYIKIAETSGIELDKPQLESIGKLVNSLTGRGNLGTVGEKAAMAANNVFFSPRFLKSNLDFLTAHQLQKGVTSFVRKQAATNLVKAIVGTASVLALANAIRPGSVETDSRSSDFGKIKIGNTRFDVTGGMGSLITLASRLLTMSSKSSITKKVTPLNSGKYGSQTGVDVLVNFAEGKLSPVAGVVRDLMKGQDFNGNKPTVLGEANNLFTPLPVTNAVSSFTTPNAANPLLTIIADALGIGANTYAPKK